MKLTLMTLLSGLLFLVGCATDGSVYVESGYYVAPPPIVFVEPWHIGSYSYHHHHYYHPHRPPIVSPRHRPSPVVVPHHGVSPVPSVRPPAPRQAPPQRQSRTK